MSHRGKAHSMSQQPSRGQRLALPSHDVDEPADTASQSSHKSGHSHSSHHSGGSQQQGSKQGSHSGSQLGRSRSGSSSGIKPQHGGQYPTPLGYDPAIGPIKQNTAHDTVNQNIDLPPDAYVGENSTQFAPRPAFNKTGQECRVHINQFRLMQLAGKDIYQYAVSASPVPKKPSLLKKLWNTKGAQSSLRQNSGGRLFLYDGRALAWSTAKCTELRVMIDLSVEQGKPPRQQDQFLLQIHLTNTVRMAALTAYLEKEMEWDKSVLECVNFLDHVIRQGPSERMIARKRNFFHPSATSSHLTPAVEAIKGIYGSIRISENAASKGVGLGVNIDVSNCAFFVGQDLHQLARSFMNSYDRQYANLQYNTMAQAFRPVEGKNGRFTMSEGFKVLRKLSKLKFRVKGRPDKLYTIKSFTFQPTRDGGNAKTVKFDWKTQQGTDTISVFDYYQKKYNFIIVNWQLPLVETTRDGYFPMEICSVERYCRYPFKLTPNETSAMMKFAVTPPHIRLKDIKENVTKLDWTNDIYLREFGIVINPELPIVPARVLKNPEIAFANGKINPGVSGRWDLRGKKFVTPNSQPLKSWGFIVTESCIDKPTAEKFCMEFVKIYRGHGGRIEAARPHLLSFAPRKPHSEIVQEAFMQTGNYFKHTPQILFFILPDKSQWVYERMKKNADCRFACISQMLNRDHVRKCQGQYISNVCLKVNAKLGGQTSRIPSVGTGSAFFKEPTMMMGVDVSHAAPGSNGASMAAITVSMDRDAAVYSATCQSNGFHVEMVQPQTFSNQLPPLLANWQSRNKTTPKHLFYLRDGVSEGQFAQVKEFEVGSLQDTFKQVFGSSPKITVIVATKRHHVRFFPEKGDKNGNPLPGTLVEREVTHPFHYDFYLCSHVAIKGTARPVHYHVIHDEIKMPVDDLQKMLYHHCYQYARATTPVSLHPAIYYAHLAGARARAHENMATSDQVPLTVKDQVIRAGLMPKLDEGSGRSSQRAKNTESEPLLPLGAPEARPECKNHFRNTMWYI